jgi:hypothetical protein
MSGLYRLVTDIPETTDASFGKWFHTLVSCMHYLNVARDLCSFVSVDIFHFCTDKVKKRASVRVSLPLPS